MARTRSSCRGLGEFFSLGYLNPTVLTGRKGGRRSDGHGCFGGLDQSHQGCARMEESSIGVCSHSEKECLRIVTKVLDQQRSSSLELCHSLEESIEIQRQSKGPSRTLDQSLEAENKTVIRITEP